MTVISGYQQQSIPASNTFQPGSTDTGKRADEAKPDKADSSTQSESSSRSQETSRKDELSATYRADESSRSRDTGSVSSSSSRGTQLDITA